MNKRQKKKHFKKAYKYALFSIELAEKYLKRYRFSPLEGVSYE